MPTTIDMDEDLKRVTVVVPPGTRWTSFEQAAMIAVTRAPVMTDWAWIIDDQGPMDDIDVAGMMRIGETFRRLAQEPLRRTHTVVVTTDRFFRTWARVVDLNYGIRKHHAAPTLAAAVALLDQLEARPLPLSPRPNDLSL